MIDNLIDVVASLTLIMQEETARLAAHAPNSSLAELAAAKQRLVSQLEADLAKIERQRGDWMETITEAQRETLFTTLYALGEASATNAATLERQIDLSVELIGAITSEAKRLAGRTTTTYGARGNIAMFDPAAPISVNSEY
jgi:flagellar biosynthesis/type III secretory pathway chaperone